MTPREKPLVIWLAGYTGCGKTYLTELIENTLIKKFNLKQRAWRSADGLKWYDGFDE